jgi:phosphonopyruvate decarboxylase
MINPKAFLEELFKHGSTLISGVPDSLLKGLLLEIENSELGFKHVPAVNEGNAVAIASGAFLATGLSQVVYMQNSGLGNSINPLVSLTHERVYATPMLLIIGWRGEPSLTDEPQHMVQGEITEAFLNSMGIPYHILDSNYQNQISDAYRRMSETNQPFALLVKKGVFNSPQNDIEGKYHLNRTAVLNKLLSSIEGDALVIGTSGKSSREIYEIREKKGETHSKDFLTIGSMGHASGIATGLALNSDKTIYLIDGDGALLMHLGSLFNLVYNRFSNVKYVLINNGSHQSVGGQKSLLKDYDESKLLKGLGFDNVIVVDNENEIMSSIERFKKVASCALVFRVSNESSDSLGRPKETPKENRSKFMENFK